MAVVAGALLTGWELRAGRPFFDVRLLARNLALTRTYLRWAVLCLCIYTVLYGVTSGSKPAAACRRWTPGCSCCR